MKRLVRLLILFVIGLAVVPFLPLYIERTLLRSWRVDRVGDQITWGWKLLSLYTYWSEYRYITREQDPGFWLAVNVGLAIFYALLISLAVEGIIVWLKRRRFRDI